MRIYSGIFGKIKYKLLNFLGLAKPVSEIDKQLIRIYARELRKSTDLPDEEAIKIAIEMAEGLDREFVKLKTEAGFV